MPANPTESKRSAEEEARILREYTARDAAGDAALTYRYANPAYQFHMQELEWELMSSLRAAGAELTGARVLEVGCGSGQILQRLAEFGAASATGVDLVPSRLEEGRRRYPALELVEANAERLPFEPGSFDVVTQFVCLSSVLDPGVRARIAAEMWRVLRPGGTLLSYDLRPPVLERTRRRRGTPGDTPTTGLDRAELERLFGTGEQLRVRPATLNFALAPLAGRSRALARLLATLPPLRSHLLLLARKPRG